MEPLCVAHHILTTVEKVLNFYFNCILITSQVWELWGLWGNVLNLSMSCPVSSISTRMDTFRDEKSRLFLEWVMWYMIQLRINDKIKPSKQLFSDAPIAQLALTVFYGNNIFRSNSTSSFILYWTSPSINSELNCRESSNETYPCQGAASRKNDTTLITNNTIINEG